MLAVSTNEEPPLRGVERALRATGRIIAVVGLAAFCGSFILGAAGGVPQETGLRILAVTLIAAAVGCLILIGRLAWPTDNKGRVTVEATLGVLCLPVRMLSFVVAGAGERVRISLMSQWGIKAIPSAIIFVESPGTTSAWRPNIPCTPAPATQAAGKDLWSHPQLVAKGTPVVRDRAIGQRSHTYSTRGHALVMLDEAIADQSAVRESFEAARAHGPVSQRETGQSDGLEHRWVLLGHAGETHIPRYL